MQINEEKDGFISLLKDVGDEALVIYNSDFEVLTKDDLSPVTLADIRVNEMIVGFLRKKYPNYAILSEESTESDDVFGSEFCFIVDPIDGTKEFVNKSGEFTINIGIAKNQKIIYGFVFAPVLGELYHGGDGFGSFLLDVKTNQEKKISVSGKIDGLCAVSSKSHKTKQEEELFSDNKDRILEEKSFGSSLKGCKVASGEADIYYRFGLTNEWDIAAMHGVIEGAGGIIRQMDGSVIFYNRGVGNHLNEKGFFAVNNAQNIFSS